MRYLDQLELKGKRVLMRVDFNVPLDGDLHVADDHRIRAALPSINYALKEGARLVLASHLGRPGGKRAERLTLAPVARQLSWLLDIDVRLAPDCVGPDAVDAVNALGPGDAVLLENLRFHSGETANDPEFASALALLADVYVNDAFAVSHRAHASVVGVPARVPVRGAGFLLKNEVDYFHRALEAPDRPLVAILGGSKVSSKLGAIRNILPRVDVMIIGGAMANTFLKSQGYDVAASLVEDDLIQAAEKLVDEAESVGAKLLLPIDCVVAPILEKGVKYGVVDVSAVPNGEMILDIGPRTLALFSDAVKGAGTVLWNGPVGAFETPPFDSGTMKLARVIGAASALSIIGGGDTDAAVHVAGEAENVSYMSTGGGAFLTLLEGKSLPGFEALEMQ